MKKKQKATWFLSGLLTALMMVSLIAPATAALSHKNVTIYPGINIYLDDSKLIPHDANGNIVDVFAYNGTTYLPVRAISETLGIPVQWDGSTNTVYLGKHTGTKPAIWIENLDYLTGSNISGGHTGKDNLGKTHTQVIYGQFTNTYLLNGQYSAISGTLFQTYEGRNYNDYDFGIKIWGDGNLLYTATVTAGTQPIDFHVDLTGVLKLEISFDGNTYWGENIAALSDCGLWT